ncbi:hypothetical protein BVX99_00445 [bacterium F16]|nr:hypothetical protein BVX99_00445 [bacterium F16]
MNFFELIEPYYGLWTVGAVLFGACFGSFLNVVIWRVPQGESIVVVPSHCPKCNHKIKPWENIPILSWLALRGKCSGCKTPISPRYIFVEALTALIWLTVWLQAWRIWQNQVENPAMPYWPIALVMGYLILLTTLIAISFIDIDHRIIPDSIIIFGICVALIMAVGWPASHEFISAPGTVHHISHKPFLAYLMEGIPRLQFLLKSARAMAVIDSVSGILLGGGFIWIISEVGKRFYGKRRFKEKEPILITLTDEGYSTDEDGLTTWEDTFIRARDYLLMTGSLKSVALSNASASLPADDFSFEGEARITEDGLVLAETTIPLDDIKELTFETQDWTVPQEPMGLGDATLMAMIGAFLGPGSVIMILCFASILGSFFGLIGVFVKRGKMYNPIPFGPYIAIATFLYILFDDQIFYVWLHLLRSIYPSG